MENQCTLIYKQDNNKCSQIWKGIIKSQPIYCNLFLTKSIFAAGEDNGNINLWDVRSNQIVFNVQE